MINKEIAKQIFIDGQIIGARQMLNAVQGKGERDVTFEEYWETIADLNETAESIDDEVFKLIDKSITK
jgi:hypothetical protein